MTLDEAREWEMTCRRLSHNPRRTRTQRKTAGGRITFTEVREMLQSQDFRCAVTGVELRPYAKGDPNPFQASLDRIDVEGSYDIENVRIVALIVNLAMNRWGEDALFELFRRQTAVVPTSD
jgi:hypothetical protein